MREPAVTTVFSVQGDDIGEFNRAVLVVHDVARAKGVRAIVTQHPVSNSADVVLEGVDAVRSSLALRDIEHVLQAQGFELVEPAPLVLKGSPGRGVEVTMGAVEKALKGIAEKFNLEPVLVEVGDLVTIVLHGGHVTEVADLATRDALHESGLVISFEL